jgi:cold shock protein
MPVTSDAMCGVAIVPGDAFPKILYGTAPGGVYRLLAISQDVMANGTIKFFNATKGFGFITPEDGSKDVFVPAVSVTASGISALKPGQLISFDTEPDSKGPKAVNLKLMADAPKVAPPPVRMPARENLPAPDAGLSRMTLFYDPGFEESQIALETLRAAGHDPRLVDYIATPPDRDALKTLSLLMRGGDQSLVRKYDPLFLELRLDDRFISDSEFWAAIVEHPSLINGPVLATAQKARVCRSENAVKSFLGIDAPHESRPAVKPKGIPGGVAAVTAAPMPAVKLEEAKRTEKPAPEQLPEKPKAKLPQKALAAAPKMPKTEAKPKPEAKAKLAAKPKAKIAAKVTKMPKKSALKPVKKAKRAAKK